MPTQRAFITALVVALGCHAPPPCADGVRVDGDEGDRCAIEWSCVDGEQLLRCDDLEGGGSECSCLVDGRLQLDDGGQSRRFTSQRSAQNVCALDIGALVAFANEGCRWNVHFGPR